MAWPIKEKLNWNTLDHTKLKGEALKAVNEVFAALEVVNAAIAKAKPLVEPQVPTLAGKPLPSGKVARLSFKVDPKGVKRMSAAAATPSVSSSSNDIEW